MTRFAFGVTLSPAERALFGGAPGSRSSFVRSHTCVVALPDETTCQVSYTRYNHRSHRFDFGSPLDQRIWIDPYLDGSVAAVEHKAQEIAAEAFAQAQEAERKQMGRKTRPTGTPKPDPKNAGYLSVKEADRCGGRYAACLKLTSGTLQRLGELHEEPSGAVQEIRSGKHDQCKIFVAQQIVIGICNRGLRHWQEPRFLAERPERAGEALNQLATHEEVSKPEDPTPSRRGRRRKAA